MSGVTSVNIVMLNFFRLIPAWKAEPVHQFMKSGKNKEGYWNIELPIEQIKAALNAFESQAPGCLGCFSIDQSSGHAALPADGLCLFLILVTITLKIHCTE